MRMSWIIRYLEADDENLPIVIEDREARKPRDKELELPVLPLREIVVFPYMVIPLFVGRSLSLKAIERWRWSPTVRFY